MNIVYHKGWDDVWRRMVQQLCACDKNVTVLRDAHHTIAGDHYVGDATTWKFWQSGLWWPTTKKDPHDLCKQCDLCQLIGQPTKKDRMPHQAILPLDPFQKYGLDFVGPFKPATTRTSNKYIIVTTDYCKKWVKEKALRDSTAVSIANVVYEYLWCRFGCLINLVSDQGGHFLNFLICDLTTHYAVVNKKSTPYYPRVNRLAESTNKTLQNILKKIMNEHQTN